MPAAIVVAAIVGDDPAQEGEENVEGFGGGLGDEDITLGNPTELGRAGDAACGPFEDAFARGQAMEDFFLVLGLRASEKMAQRNGNRAHDAANTRRQGREIGGRWLGLAEERRRIFRGIRLSKFGASGEFFG